MLTISSPNTDRSLLTLAELRVAAGVTDGSKDAALTTLGNRISASITKACRVAVDGAIPPTLRLETVTDTYRLKSHSRALILSRRPIVTVTSVTENDVVLDALTDYEIEAAAGMLRRLSGDSHTCWPCGKITVVYSAGYSTVPDDLKLAAVKFVQAEVVSDGRDPLLKSKETVGVSTYEWWVDPGKESVIPDPVMSLLEAGGYVNTWVG